MPHLPHHHQGNQLSLAVAMETISPSPWKQPTGRQLLEWEEVAAKGEGGMRSQTLLCCLPGSIQEEPRAWKFPLCSGMWRHSPSGQNHKVEAGMSLEKHRIEGLFSECISSGCLSFSPPLSRSKEMPQFSCLTNAGNLPDQVLSLSDLVPTCWVALGNSATSPGTCPMDWRDYLNEPWEVGSLAQYKLF